MCGRTPRRLTAGILASVVLVAGCSGRGLIRQSDELPTAPPWPDPPGANAAYPSTDALLAKALGADATVPDPLARPLSPGSEKSAGRPLNVLVLSGGGKYTSFNAGNLVGWTASGTRPTFDVATGVSSGALCAAFAFLGPKYDCKLTELYTTLRRRDLYRMLPFIYLPLNHSLASSKPLEKLIETEVNDTFMADLRQAHTEGRRLFVATSQVKAQRLVIWDVGALACSGRPDAKHLVHKVLLAATCINGFTKPIDFDVVVNGCQYTEKHGDGGIHTEGFVQTAAGLPPGSNVYILTAGKLYPDPLADRAGFFTLFYSNVSCALSALYRADLMKMYALCQTTHSNFLMVSLAQNVPGKPSSLVFDPEEMLRLYNIGYKMFACGVSWRTVPPGVPENEQPSVRDGSPGLPVLGEPKHPRLHRWYE